MRKETWLQKNGTSLEGKTIAITGATGGLGREICMDLLALGGNLVLLNRNPEKNQALRRELLAQYPKAQISDIPVDLTDIGSVKAACAALSQLPLDILIHNAGAYSIPREICSTGLLNVFQINFAAPYYMTKQLLPLLSQRRGKVVVMGSIAHTYSRSDPRDPDFSTRTGSSLIYGNSKRYLMFAMGELFKDHPQVEFAIAHPGITFTGITDHYPKVIFAIIKHPMKVIFMKPATAARGMILAVCRKIPYLHWAGPKLFDIWGNPSVKLLRTCDPRERQRIFRDAEKMYQKLL